MPSASGTALSRFAHAIAPLATESTSPSWPVGLGIFVSAVTAPATLAALFAAAVALVAALDLESVAVASLSAAAVALVAALVSESAAAVALCAAAVA